MKKKKVVIISNYSGDYGSEKMLNIISKTLSKDYTIREYINSNNNELYHNSKFNVISNTNKRVSIKDLFWWFKILKYENPDLVLVNISLIIEPIIASKLLGVKSIVFIRESLVDYKLLFFFYKLFSIMFIDKIYCNSMYTYNMFSHTKKRKLLYDAIDVNCNKNYSIDKKEEINIIYIGRISERKGVLTMLDAFYDIKYRLTTKVNIKIAGDYKDSEIKKKVEKRKTKIESEVITVEILGFVKNIYEVLQKGDLFIAPSILPETFGLTVIEAMSCGLPVIANDIGAYKETVINDFNGYRFNGEKEDLSTKILEVLNIIRTPKYEYLSKNAFDSVKKFDKKNYQKKLLKEINNDICYNC